MASYKATKEDRISAIRAELRSVIRQREWIEEKNTDEYGDPYDEGDWSVWDQAEYESLRIRRNKLQEMLWKMLRGAENGKETGI